MTKITDDELSALSDEERAAIEDDADAADTADTAQDAAANEKEDDDATDDKPNDADESSGDANQASGADNEAADDAEIAEPLTPILSAPDVNGFDEQTATLEAQRKEIRAQYRAGAIDADTYDNQLDDIGRKLSSIEVAKSQAALTDQFNRDIETSRYVSVLNTFKEQARGQGIDYDANPALLDMFDAKIKALAANEANEDKSYDWFLRTAHQNVLAEQTKIAEALGFAKPQKTAVQEQGKADAVKKAIAGRKQDRPAVGSLATIPSAAGEQPNASEFSHLDSLVGDDLESAVARMTPDQQDRWLRAS